MTIAEVKRELPMVRVKWGRKQYWARVSGRLNQFATVSPYQVIDHKKPLKTILGPCLHFSWEAVARAVNNDSTLLAD